MKEIKLSNSDKVVLVDDADFDRLSTNVWKLGTHGHPYCWKLGYKLMSHVILQKFDGSMEVDHIDRNPLNNQRGNLRLCNSSQNKANARKHKDGSSKYKGVGWDKARKLWKSRIMIDGRQINLGRFKTEEDAARAYNDYATKHGGQFMLLNVI